MPTKEVTKVVARLGSYHKHWMDEAMKTGRFKTQSEFFRTAIVEFSKKVVKECHA